MDMNSKLTTLNQEANFARYIPTQKKGHYESYFLRANHPTKPIAFWIRYTIFSPHKKPEKAIGELWAIVFDGETGVHAAVKDELPISKSLFDKNRFHVKIGDAHLDSEKLQGSASSGSNTIRWDLSYAGNDRPLFLFPMNLYDRKLPKAKALVGVPLALFNGRITVNDREVAIKDWVGSQNHNWGSQHTDHYAWGQIAGFDNHAESFFELATARIRIGPFWTPFMTLMVLRHRGREFCLNSIRQSLKAEGSFEYFQWKFSSEDETVAVDGTISAAREDFIGLKYYNPPGGIKHCLNTKIASCRMMVRLKKEETGERTEVLETLSRAAFEILTDKTDHGVKMYT